MMASFFEENLEKVESIYHKLKAQGKWLATAESCTGGLLSATLVAFAGISEVFKGGVCAYSNFAKEVLLGVDPVVLAEKGAVSEEVARQMAQGACEKLVADYGVGITGIAGPSGGTAEKPVGLVYVGYASKTASKVIKYQFSGDRNEIRQATVSQVLRDLESFITENS